MAVCAIFFFFFWMDGWGGGALRGRLARRVIQYRTATACKKSAVMTVMTLTPRSASRYCSDAVLTPKASKTEAWSNAFGVTMKTPKVPLGVSIWQNRNSIAFKCLLYASGPDAYWKWACVCCVISIWWELNKKISCSVKTLNIIRIPLISLATLKLQISFKFIYIYMYYIMF